MRSEASIIFRASIAIVTATAVAFLAKLLRQPQLFRFIWWVPELMVSGALARCFPVALIAERLGLSRPHTALGYRTPFARLASVNNVLVTDT